MKRSRYVSVCLAALVGGLSVAFAYGTGSASNQEPAAAPPTTVPFATIGGPDDAISHTSVLVGPVESGVRFSLTPSAQTVRLGQRINLSIWFSSATGKLAEICVGMLGSRLQFHVTNERGVVLPGRGPSGGENARQSACMLSPISQWRFVVPLDDFITISQPGSYTVRATIAVSLNARRQELTSNPVTLIVTP